MSEKATQQQDASQMLKPNWALLIKFLTGGWERNGVCHICVARACSHTPHTDGAHAFRKTSLLVVSRSTLIDS